MNNKIHLLASVSFATSMLGEVRFSTTSDHMQIELRCGSDLLFSGRFYPDERDFITLYDVGSIIEHYLAVSGESISTFKFVVSQPEASTPDRVEQDFVAFYCRHLLSGISVKECLVDVFLTAARARRIPPGAYPYLSRYAENGDRMSYSFYADFVAPDGYADQLSCHGGDLNIIAKEPEVNTFYFWLDEVERRIAELALRSSVRLLSVTCESHGRGATFFIDRSLATRSRTFYFRNSFNVVDIVCVPCTVKTKQKVERSEALLIDRAALYDRSESTTYEVESDGLTLDEIALCRELFASHDVRVMADGDDLDPDFDAMVPVLITESECEASDGDEKPNTVKFTYRYDTRRNHAPRLSSPGIFNEPFNFPFT